MNEIFFYYEIPGGNILEYGFRDIIPFQYVIPDRFRCNLKLHLEFHIPSFTYFFPSCHKVEVIWVYIMNLYNELKLTQPYGRGEK